MLVKCSENEMAQSIDAFWNRSKHIPEPPTTKLWTHHAPHTRAPQTYTNVHWLKQQPKTPNTTGKWWPPSWPSRRWPRSWQHRAKSHRREVLWLRPRRQRWRWCSWDRRAWNLGRWWIQICKGIASFLPKHFSGLILPRSFGLIHGVSISRPVER